MFLKDSVAVAWWFQECLAATLGRKHLFAGWESAPKAAGSLDDWMMIGCLECFCKSRFVLVSATPRLATVLWLNIFLYNAFSLICGNDGRVVCSSKKCEPSTLQPCWKPASMTRPPWPSMAFWRSSATSFLFNMLWDVYGFSDFEIWVSTKDRAVVTQRADERHRKALWNGFMMVIYTVVSHKGRPLIKAINMYWFISCF